MNLELTQLDLQDIVWALRNAKPDAIKKDFGDDALEFSERRHTLIARLRRSITRDF